MNGASFWLKKLALIQTKSITLSKVGGMPLARLRLRLPTREGEVTNLNQWGKTFKTPGTSVSPGRARPCFIIVTPAFVTTGEDVTPPVQMEEGT